MAFVLSFLTSKSCTFGNRNSPGSSTSAVCCEKLLKNRHFSSIRKDLSTSKLKSNNSMRAVVGHAEKEENSLVYIHCVQRCRLSKFSAILVIKHIHVHA